GRRGRELRSRAPDRQGRSPCRSEGRTRGGCTTTPSKQATVREVKNEPGSEIFDDLYLGVRAGGALRKKRRGELLTAEEAEALSRWRRLSAWRRAFGVGGFGAGTSGLVFALGGLVFGRWRRPCLVRPRGAAAPLDPRRHVSGHDCTRGDPRIRADRDPV